MLELFFIHGYHVGSNGDRVTFWNRLSPKVDPYYQGQPWREQPTPLSRLIELRDKWAAQLGWVKDDD